MHCSKSCRFLQQVKERRKKGTSLRVFFATFTECIRLSGIKQKIHFLTVYNGTRKEKFDCLLESLIEANG
jgi:hypothetical protein